MSNETLPQINVGETLRRARERSGQDLRYVADMLRIRYAYLEAIENGEYQKLPGAPYAIGFVRAYADHLNLNSVETVERFKKERADLDQQTQLVFPKPLPEGKVPSGGILLVAVVLGIFVYGAWFFLSGQDKPIVELIPEIPARLMALVGVEDDAEAPAEETAEADAPVVPGDTSEPETADAGAPPSEPAMEAQEAAVDDPDAPAAEPEEVATGPVDDSALPDAPAEAEVAADLATEPAPVPETPAAETEPVVAETVEPEPADEPVGEETAAVEETPADVPVAAEPAVVAEETPDEPAPAEQVAREPQPEDTAPAQASEPSVAEVTVQPGASTEEPTPPAVDGEDADAAAIAQRALDELGDTEEDTAPAPAETAPEQAAAAATEPPSEPQVNGDPLAGGGTGAPDAAEVSVATITPAARTPGAPETDETADEPATNGARSTLVPARPGAKIYGEENRRSRILITARVDSWVEVSTQQGELLLTRVLRAGDSFRVPDRAGLSLVTGNAGGLAISVDGSQVPDLGPVGAVRRGVELDPERLKAGTAGNL